MAPSGTSITNGSIDNSKALTTLSNTTKESLEKRGFLEATVLSAYDLPFADDVPKGVTLSACGLTVQSGPPLARHKDRNSFRFSGSTDSNGKSSPTRGSSSNSGSNSSEVTKLVAPLRDLYQSTLKIRLVYSDPQKYLEAELPLRQLRIHEQKWLILTLSPPDSSETPAAGGGTASGETATQPVSPDRKSSVDDEDMSPRPTIRIKFKLSGP